MRHFFDIGKKLFPLISLENQNVLACSQKNQLRAHTLHKLCQNVDVELSVSNENTGGHMKDFVFHTLMAKAYLQFLIHWFLLIRLVLFKYKKNGRWQSPYLNVYNTFPGSIMTVGTKFKKIWLQSVLLDWGCEKAISNSSIASRRTLSPSFRRYSNEASFVIKSECLIILLMKNR